MSDPGCTPPCKQANAEKCMQCSIQIPDTQSSMPCRNSLPPCRLILHTPRVTPAIFNQTLSEMSSIEGQANAHDPVGRLAPSFRLTWANMAKLPLPRTTTPFRRRCHWPALPACCNVQKTGTWLKGCSMLDPMSSGPHVPRGCRSHGHGAFCPTWSTRRRLDGTWTRVT